MDKNINLTHPLQVTVIWEVTAYKGLSFIWMQKSKFHHKSPAGFIFCWINDKLVAYLFKVFLVHKEWSILKSFMEQLHQILKAAFPIVVPAMWYLQFQILHIGISTLSTCILIGMQTHITEHFAHFIKLLVTIEIPLNTSKNKFCPHSFVMNQHLNSSFRLTSQVIDKMDKISQAKEIGKSETKKITLMTVYKSVSDTQTRQPISLMYC